MPTNLLRAVFWVLLFSGLCVGFARLTSLRWWQVPEDDAELGASVAPTLRPGDWLILWRLTPPGFGDLVLCPDPEEPGEVLIARIAGEEGDTVMVDEDGNLQVNGVRMLSERACKPPTFKVENPRTGDEVELRCDTEVLGGVHHQRGMRPSSSLRPLPINRKVDDGKLFLVSDNRLHPFDSRDFGALPREGCSERIIFRLVSRLGFSHVSTRLTWIQ
jgi:signal peptidase I